jgi:hypothetical protein
MVKRICSGFLYLVFFLLPVLLSSRAEADMVSGNLELDYDTLRSVSTDAGGNTVRAQSHDFFQQYTLNVNLNPFSTMNASGGLYVTKAEGSGNSITTVQPYVDVKLQDPFSIYSAGASYRQLRTTTNAADALSATLVQDQYNSFLGWTPFELPSFSIQATRSRTYDTAHVIQDSRSDLILLSARYAPWRQWDFLASISYNDDMNNLTQLHNTTVHETGSVNFRDSFLGRVSLASAYIIDLSTTTTAQQGTGTVPFQLFPLAGYSATTDFPDLPDNLGASPNGALINGNLAVSAGVNIGTSVSLPPDNKFREMGVDFGTITEVNNVEIWINQTLTPVIANSFAWNVYTSTDNTNWTFLQTIQPAVFGQFENKFSIDISSVRTRYLKVATRPLSLAVLGATAPGYQNIFVTEMVAFLNRPAAEVRGDSSQLSQQFNLSSSTRIAEGFAWILSYNMNQTSSKFGETELTSHRWGLSNGLALTRPFKIGPTLTANARFTRDDNFDSNGNRQGSYNYGAGLVAVPLQTLRGGLQYSGSLQDDHTKADNFILTGTADLYQGVSINATGGMNFSVAGETKARTEGTSFRTGAGLVPHQALSLSGNYSKTRQALNTFGIVAVDISEQWDAGANYRPFEALYLTAAISRFHGTNRRSITLTSYGLNWSPFSGGTVQFSVGYTESYESVTDLLTKTLGPTLTWALAPRASITVSYFVQTISDPQGSRDVRSLFGQYKMTF